MNKVLVTRFMKIGLTCSFTHIESIRDGEVILPMFLEPMVVKDIIVRLKGFMTEVLLPV